MMLSDKVTCMCKLYSIVLSTLNTIKYIQSTAMLCEVKLLVVQDEKSEEKSLR